MVRHAQRTGEQLEAWERERIAEHQQRYAGLAASSSEDAGEVF